MKTVAHYLPGGLAVSLLVLTTLRLTAFVPSSETKLVPADTTYFQQAGYAVAIDGDKAVIGAPLDSAANASAGAAYVFVRNGGTWTEQAKLTAGDAGFSAEFGNAVAISGDTIVVGAHLDPADDYQGGAAYVFVRNGTTWSQQAKLAPPDPAVGKQFGAAVAIDGDTIAISAIGDGEGAFNAGAVYVFTRSAGAWTQQAKLTSNDPRPGNSLGFSVGLDGDTLVAGSPFDEETANIDSGAVYVFVRSGTTWGQEAELRANDGAESDLLGWSVSLNGDTLVAGAPDNNGTGAAYVFVRDAGSWSQQTKLVGDDVAAGDLFGYSVGLSGNAAAVGSLFDSSFVVNGTPVDFGGSVYLFQRSGTTWTQDAEVSANDLESFDEFGFSVAVSGSTVIIGAPFKGPLDDGAAYVFAADANTAPVANSQSVTTDEDAAKSITLTASDAEANPLTFAVLSAPTKGTLSGTAPHLSYTPNRNENGSDSFTFKANDGSLDSAVATVSITITPVNDAPVANNQSVVTDEDTPVTLTLVGSDVEGDALTFAVVSGPVKGTLSGTPPNLTYTPNRNENGPDSFTFKANDGSLDSVSATVSIVITPVNDGPTISGIGDQTTTENSATAPIAFVVGDIDNDVNALIVSAVSDNPTLVPETAFSFVSSGPGRTLTVRPAPNQFGMATITVTVSDGALSASDAFVLTVTPQNHPPVADASASETLAISLNNCNASVTLDGSRSSDADGDRLTYTWFADGTKTPVGTGMTTTVTLKVGTHSVKLAVNDGAASGSDTISVKVITLADAIHQISEDVEELDIPRALKKEIIAELKAATRAAERGNFKAVLNDLRELSRKISAQGGKKIDPETAAALLGEIQGLIDILPSR